MKKIEWIAIICCGLLSACSKDPVEKISPQTILNINPENYVGVINNKYFPLVPGKTFYYRNTIVEDGETICQDITVCVTADTKVILGVICRVVHDVVKEDGQITEDTYDWYAQDKEGNVWYFGEDTKSYDGEGGISTEGSWMAGVDGAEAGIIMHSNPAEHIDEPYYQEYYKGKAEDQAIVLDVNSMAKVPYGTFNNCVRTKEYTALEPGVTENKYYAPGVGLVLTVMVEGGKEREELIKVTEGK